MFQDVEEYGCKRGLMWAWVEKASEERWLATTSRLGRSRNRKHQFGSNPSSSRTATPPHVFETSPPKLPTSHPWPSSSTLYQKTQLSHTSIPASPLPSHEDMAARFTNHGLSSAHEPPTPPLFAQIKGPFSLELGNNTKFETTEEMFPLRYRDVRVASDENMWSMKRARGWRRFQDLGTPAFLSMLSHTDDTPQSQAMNRHRLL
ncbi:hypothetical protein DFH27DRAFT_615893 [Peziza echinospora]|nr:hypothetical protein DFH27DRAFT_615893 [Peziza echinospora]